MGRGDLEKRGRGDSGMWGLSDERTRHRRSGDVINKQDHLLSPMARVKKTSLKKSKYTSQSFPAQQNSA